MSESIKRKSADNPTCNINTKWQDHGVERRKFGNSDRKGEWALFLYCYDDDDELHFHEIMEMEA